jgi:hypothetical protein
LERSEYSVADKTDLSDDQQSKEGMTGDRKMNRLADDIHLITILVRVAADWFKILLFISVLLTGLNCDHMSRPPRIHGSTVAKLVARRAICSRHLALTNNLAAWFCPVLHGRPLSERRCKAGGIELHDILVEHAG